MVRQLEDLIEHRYSDDSEVQQTCIDPHSSEKISTKDDLDDSNEHLRTISMSQVFGASCLFSLMFESICAKKEKEKWIVLFIGTIICRLQ